MNRILAALLVVGLFFAAVLPNSSRAGQFRIALMQDQQGAGAKYKPLLDYLVKKGISASFVGTKDYRSAAEMFSAGQADAMFSGSGVAGTMIIKELAEPVARPVGKDGFSTYWAVIIARQGAPKFTESADYFSGKRVIFTSLASAGEFYYRSLPGAARTKATLMHAASHGAALDALDRGQADFAIVKNRVWDKNKDKYPKLAKVGEDKDENPDGALIVSKKADQATASKVVGALLGLKDDSSPEAQAAKNGLEIQGFIKTTTADFKHTLPLLKDAGVTKTFNFQF